MDGPGFKLIYVYFFFFFKKEKTDALQRGGWQNWKEKCVGAQQDSVLNLNVGIGNLAGLTRSHWNVRGGSLENSAPPRCSALGTSPCCLLRIVVCSGASVTRCLG